MMGAVQIRRAAFDAIAAQYDDLFTNSLIGRAQRDAVWDVVRRHLRPGNSVLELNCGTGEDAFFLAKCGMSVVGCDISPGMIDLARERALKEDTEARVQFLAIATEDIANLSPTYKFDAAFSNFSGLNCVADLHKAAQDLARLLPVGSPAILCFSNKFCAWEIAWYLLRARPAKAFRRWTSRPAVASIGSERISVHYPSVASIAAEFSPFFRLAHVYGVGITVPPSYVEAWIRRIPRTLAAFRQVDRVLSPRRLFRSLGDHVVLVMERTEP